MARQSSPPVSGLRAFPQPRLNRTLSRLIDRVLVMAIRHPVQARALLEAANIDAATAFRLLSGSKRRRTVQRRGAEEQLAR